MNYLINEEFLAIRRGEAVTASETNREFLLNEKSDYPMLTLREIAKANNLNTSGRNKKMLLSEILINLGELKMAEQNELTESEKVKKIVKEGIKAGSDQDTILIKLVTNGVEFKKATKLYNSAMQELGIITSPKERSEIVTKQLNAINFTKNCEKYEQIESAVDSIVKLVKGSTKSQILRSIRQYAKDKEIKLPKKPQSSETRGRKAGGGKVITLCNWLNENPQSSEKQYLEKVAELVEKEPQRKGYLKFYYVVISSRKSALSSVGAPIETINKDPEAEESKNEVAEAA